ncbi:DUF6415 family natural product biosynthesis protein [Streptomyces purpureus]|uniref:Uncharacterized protein n=1 Tax=Streptomyces purpureus TaxID=1951 RepID=A0A918H5K6_9ACTN|nr:DUF6415 family natural product biosynthesis protein [Streptomyces purpureus]GGT38883.1 hypothetical protein GCM10014713_35840 [Streptomyces purpureus]
MQERHDRPTGYVEIPLGPVLAEAADAIVTHVEETAELNIRRAIGMRDHPGEQALTDLTRLLVAHCTSLADGVRAVPEERRTVRGITSLMTWETLVASGPEPGPLGTWSHARHLAQVARDMLDEVRSYRNQEASFVARPGLPPLALGPKGTRP